MGTLENKLYILHGWTIDTERWTPFLNRLKQENIDFEFLKIPGLTAPIDRPWTISDYVEWLSNILPSNRRSALLGHSNGGRIALSFVLKYPERIDHLFLLDSAGIYHNDFITKTKRNIFGTIAALGKKITSSENTKDLLYKLAQESDYREASPLMRETMKNLIGIDLLPQLSKISVPTTIIWGRQDAVTPFADASIFKKGIRNSKLFVVEGARHSPQFTHVDEVTKIIKEELIR